MLNYNVSFNPTVTHKGIYWLAHFEDKQNEIQRRQEYLQSQIWLSGNAQPHTQVHQTSLKIILCACALEFNTTTSGSLVWELNKTIHVFYKC